MITYTRTSMIKKEHIKAIVHELEKLGSKAPKELNFERDHSLAYILCLAIGDGTFKLSTEQINQIANDEFSIEWK